MRNNSKHQLPLALLSLHQKCAAVFFKRMILNDESEDDSADVIEYDHHCEGIEILVDFYKTRQQGILLKAFSSIRQYQPSHQKIQTKKTVNTTTRRTFMNSTLSDASPIREIQMKTIKSQKADISALDFGDSKLAGSKVDLKHLLNRVKEINSQNYNSYSFR
ncbi:MAG: hypothetical protein KDD45_18175 [Bdellovibrionales bacterium]|nr:hypothetical protein [Bdellovibrionales bacterium]